MKCVKLLLSTYLSIFNKLVNYNFLKSMNTEPNKILKELIEQKMLLKKEIKKGLQKLACFVVMNECESEPYKT